MHGNEETASNVSVPLPPQTLRHHGHWQPLSVPLLQPLDTCTQYAWRHPVSPPAARRPPIGDTDLSSKSASDPQLPSHLMVYFQLLIRLHSMPGLETDLSFQILSTRISKFSGLFGKSSFRLPPPPLSTSFSNNCKRQTISKVS